MSNYVVSDASLGAVADAIREKGGTSEPLEFPDGFVTAIGDISGGGGRVSVPSKDVDFIDYDGAIVYSYTAEEFLALSAMPENPDHSGDEVPLTSLGWNWTLADAQEQVGITGELTIGQLYIPTDGKTHIKIHLEKGRTSPILGCCPNGTVDVDWGDGTAHSTLTGTSVTTVKYTSAHEYAAAGDYWITLTVTGRCGLFGTSSLPYILRATTGSSSTTIDKLYRALISEVYLGKNIDMRNYAFYDCRGLETIVIPNDVTSFGNSTFSNCYLLRAIVLPKRNSFPQYLLNNCYGLKQLSMSAQITSIGMGAIYNCYTINRICIPKNVTTINNMGLQSNPSVSRFMVPNKVTSIGASGLSTNTGVKEYHFLRTTPPTLSQVNALANMPDDCIIYVPYSEDHSILAAYKAATNWSTYASKMQEEPQ